MEPVDTSSEREALMPMPSTATEMPSSDPAVSPPPGPLLLDTVTRAPSTEPVDTTMERGAPTLTTDTVTDSVLALLPTQVSPGSPRCCRPLLRQEERRCRCLLRLRLRCWN